MQVIDLILTDSDLNPNLLFTDNQTDSLDILLNTTFGDNYFSNLFYDLSIFKNINPDFNQLIVNDLINTSKINIQTNLKYI